MTYQEFCARLNLLINKQNTYLLVDADHPLNIYIGYNDLLQLSLMININFKINDIKIPETRIISISSVLRENNKYALIFACKENESKDIFLRLCFDLIETARKARKQDKISCLIQRYLQWRKMLEGIRPDLLTLIQQKGLCGELLYLIELGEQKGFSYAIESWMGPYKSDQDFIMDDTWTEVKSIKYAAESVSISSIEQLDNDLPGLLAIYYIEQTSDQDSSGFTLLSLVEKIFNQIKNNPDLKLSFGEKLWLYGCDITEKEYKKNIFTIKGRIFYDVVEKFPKLKRSNISSAISSANYTISLNMIEEFMRK